MNRKAQRAALIKEAQEIISKAGDSATDEQLARLDEINTEVKSLTEAIDRAEKGDQLIAAINSLGETHDETGERPAKSLGDHFVKGLQDGQLAALKAQGGYTIGSTEFKAATDPQATPAAFQVPLLTDVDRSIVREYRRPTVSDLLGVGTISGTAVTYFVEGAVEGAFTTVAAGAQKPQIHVADPTARTDALKKIAAWFDMQDEMVEDVPFWVSEINNRGLYLLSLAEENQLLNGDGTGSNVEGLLVRSGVQTETKGAGTEADALFRAMTKVQTATGLAPDGILINPLDYQTLRLAKDANDQYYGGGFFTGQYGSDGLAWQPPVWGLRTVVSSAVSQGTAVVGAFKAASTVYRKGGVRVESTNSDLGKFTQNKVTTRIEERLALAVRIPAAIVKVTL